MKNNILRVFVVVSLFMLAVCIAASQGLYWESTISAPAAGKEMKSSNSYRAKMFKQSFENNTMIYRLDKETMYIVNNEKKEYAAMTFAEMEAAAKQANDRMAEVKKTLKNMPPAQREAMEKALNSPGMPGGQKSKIDIKKTAEKKTVNGYTCVKYILKENGKDAGTIWATSGVPDYDKMKNEMKEFSERLMAQIPNAKELAAAMKKVEGFPMETTIAGITTTVTKVEKRSIPAGEFEVPSGYKKVDKKEITGQ